MLLSIDRVLQLFTEGKSIDKIAEMAECDTSDVISLIEEARNLLNKHEKDFAKRKLLIKKRKPYPAEKKMDDENYIKEILSGAELSAVPLDTALVMYVDGASSGNPGHAGIGIVIFDSDDRQVGRISDYIGIRTNNVAEYSALIRALKIAEYFRAVDLKVRTDSELVVKQINGEYRVKNPDLKVFFDEAKHLISKLNNFKIEHIPRGQNDKADYFAKKGSERVLEKSKRN